jgi:hypothetical protein
VIQDAGLDRLIQVCLPLGLLRIHRRPSPLSVTPGEVITSARAQLSTAKPLAPRKFGRPKTSMNGTDTRLILEIYKEQNSGARRFEIVIEHKYGKHVPHNAIHQVLLENGLAEENMKKKKRRKPYIRKVSILCVFLHRICFSNLFHPFFLTS